MIVFIGVRPLKIGTTTLYRKVGNQSPRDATQYRRRMEVSTAQL